MEAFNQFFECKLGSVIFKQTWRAVSRGEFFLNAIFHIFKLLKSGVLKVILSGVVNEMVDKIICLC